MKKVLAIFMSAIIGLLFCVQTFAYSVDRKEFYPIIIVPGYASAGLYHENEDGSKTHVWNIEVDKILGRLLARSFDVAKGIGKLKNGDAKYIADVVGGEFCNMFELLRCNPDGSSVYELKQYCSTAADSNSTYLDENMDGMHEYEPEIMEMYGNYIGENYKDYIFNYNTDFRMGAVYNAGTLNDYVDDVLEYTGAEKVNIYCISHGGQIGATFLNLYGEEKADVLNNVILTEPATGGSGVAYDLLRGDVTFDEENLIWFIEYGMMFEEDYHWILSEENLDFIDDILNYLIPYIRHVIEYWGSIWDFIPKAVYEKTRDSYLDKNASAGLIEKTDNFHNVVYPAMREKLQACVDAGINVYIIAGSGIQDLAGYDGVNCDSFIVLEGATGATVAPLGERFNDGYQTLNTSCSDPTHNHLSPKMDVDMSTGYLPEQTWIVDGLYHGMTIKNDYTTELITMMMFNDELIDVHTYKDFPQFHADTNRSQAVTAKFDNSVEGYISGDDTALVITNCSKKYDMRLVSVLADGVNIGFDCSLMKEIPAGQSITIPFKGNIPEVSRTAAHITVNYVQVGSITPIGSRTLNFTIMNGKAPKYDTENPVVSAAAHADSILNFINSFISSLFVQKLVTVLFNSSKALLANVVTSVIK